MDMRMINYFISVYEERSFTKAAEKVHVVQSALSMQIRNLEEELGAALFERNPKGVEPTVAGRRFHELCVPVARDIAFAKQEILDLVQGKTVSGSLRIGLPSSICRSILGSVLNEFADQYPNVDLTVVEAYHRILSEQIQAGALDVALGAVPRDFSGLSFRPSVQDNCVLVSGSPINGKSFTPCDLFLKKDLKLVIPTERHYLGSLVNGYVLSGKITPKRLMKIDGTNAAMECVIHSDWGALSPVTSIIHDISSKELFVYPVVNPDIKFDLHVLHDQRRPLTLAARCFIEMLEKELARVADLWAEAVANASPSRPARAAGQGRSRHQDF